MDDIYHLLVVGVRKKELFSLALLDHHMRHYRRRGLSNHVISIVWDDPSKHLAERVAAHLTDEYDAEIHMDGVYEEFDVWESLDLRRKLQQRVPQNAWIVNPDLDEFAIVGDYGDQASDMETIGVDAIAGELIDCFAQGWVLNPVIREYPIEDQFPVRMKYTRMALGAGVDKVGMARNFIPIQVGNHRVPDEYVDRCYIDNPVPILHYKWTHGLRERVSLLRDRSARSPEKYPWRGEYDSVLASITDSDLFRPFLYRFDFEAAQARRLAPSEEASFHKLFDGLTVS